MDDCTDPVAVVSALIAGLSLLVAGLSLLGAGGSLWLARRADKRADRGQPSVKYLGISGNDVLQKDSKSLGLRFHIKNVGAAGARHITLHLRDRDGVQIRGQKGGEARSNGVNLAAGDEAVVTIPVANPGLYSYPLTVRIRWLHWDSDQDSRRRPYERDSNETVDPFSAEIAEGR